jgi:hypothetical protein
MATPEALTEVRAKMSAARPPGMPRDILEMVTGVTHAAS